MKLKGFKFTMALLTSMILLAPILISQQSFAASPSPSPSASSSGGQGTAPIQTIAPVYPDTNVPQIISLSTSGEKTDNLYTLTVQLGVRVHRNTLSSVTITLLPRIDAGALVDPIFQAPCTKLGQISSTTLAPTGELASLQTRSADGDWYKESYVFSSQTKLPAGQNICLGKYVITAINIVDAAKHTLVITANQASTTSAKSTFNDVATQSSNIWASHLELAKCPQAVNANPVTTTSGGKTTTTTPVTSASLRTTCDHTINFANVYLTAVADTSIGGTGATTSTGTSTLPIVDYVSQVKSALAENVRMKSQQDQMTKQIESLQKRIEIYQGGGKPTPDPSSSGSSSALPIVDYQKQAKELQAQVDALSKQLAAFMGKPTAKATSKTVVKKPTAKATSKTVVKKPTTKVTAKPTSKPTAKSTAKSSVSGSNRNGQGSNGSGQGSNRNRNNRQSRSPSPAATIKK
ncbi:MAG: hypothetical protein F2690_00715 [Actinobacteria bacterium]|uniref:Unannotated protein n=1 Tax=freshwater metagenome TaxID=449393 RepID=A0A6J6ZA68_9ZZZZ|nr:hypothetical protein [Actinomycetota bacterium]MSX71577.1 hypothetical protein [Actinomycetota bacterium]MSY69081.1 hypothetical protein [Actinomycetota bacterium]MTA75522.1 hypothetical protein [Actinomycetota bacterium]